MARYIFLLMLLFERLTCFNRLPVIFALICHLEANFPGCGTSWANLIVSGLFSSFAYIFSMKNNGHLR